MNSGPPGTGEQRLRVRVYYEDTDASGVVYHANYLKYFERARTEWLEARGLDHRRLAIAEGIVFTLADARIVFQRPARLDDRLDVTTKIAEHRRASIVFAQAISRDGEPAIKARFTVACVRPDDFRPCRIPRCVAGEAWMSVATDLSLWSLIMQASLLVKGVLLLLLLASITSWVMIFSKRRLIKRTVKDMEWFESRFWSGGNLADIYAETDDDEPAQGMPAMFRAGYEEFERQRNENHGFNTPQDILPSVQRNMKVIHARELERLESGLVVLATIGSISPYVGLFGTVWGIMSAFIGLGNVEQASLSMVAPGIAEALIATAMGLFAAIPATVAYNIFSNRLDFIENRLDTFMEEVIGIVERGIAATTHSNIRAAQAYYYDDSDSDSAQPVEDSRLPTY